MPHDLLISVSYNLVDQVLQNSPYMKLKCCFLKLYEKLSVPNYLLRYYLPFLIHPHRKR